MKEIYDMLVSEDDTIFKTGIILLFLLSEKEFAEFLGYSPAGGVHYVGMHHTAIGRYRNRLILDRRISKRNNAHKIGYILIDYDLFDEIMSIL